MVASPRQLLSGPVLATGSSSLVGGGRASLGSSATANAAIALLPLLPLEAVPVILSVFVCAATLAIFYMSIREDALRLGRTLLHAGTTGGYCRPMVVRPVSSRWRTAGYGRSVARERVGCLGVELLPASCWCKKLRRRLCRLQLGGHALMSLSQAFVRQGKQSRASGRTAARLGLLKRCQMRKERRR